MANNRIPYTSRNFDDIRADLVGMVKQYYPDTLNSFNDASIGMLFVELAASIGDVLSFNTDRAFQETQLESAQERSSVYSLARTFGLKIPNQRPSATIVDFSVTVPVFGDTFDISYCPIIQGGGQVTGGGKIFENASDIDFSNPFSIGGIPNRLVEPQFDSNNTLINYRLTKREIVVNGFTKVYKKTITNSESQPFFELFLPDNDVISVDSVITLDGTNISIDQNSTYFSDINNKWYEVDSLAEDKYFVEDLNKSSDSNAIRPGKYIQVDKRFITETTDLGFTKLIFGGGSQDISSLYNFDVNGIQLDQIGNIVNNSSLGRTLKPNTTMFIKYRVGGGSNSNIGQGTLTNLGFIDMVVNGSESSKNLSVKNSLTTNNPIPALGGKDAPSIEEIRNLIRYNFSAQNRAVTIKDYQSRIALMNGKFGIPFKVGVVEEKNKIKIYIMGVDSDGKLNNTSTSTLKENIATYLSNYRMLNDYIEVTNARIVNLSFQVDLLIDKQFKNSQVTNEVVTQIYSYLNVSNFQMGENIYLSNLVEIINKIPGVLNVIELRIYNLVGGRYSTNEISQPYLDSSTRQIDYLDNYTLYGESDVMFEILDKNTDISVRTK